MRDVAAERQLAMRVALEEPRTRAARRALERWITVQRLWAAMDRREITDEGERIRFVCRALWPTLTGEQVEALVTRATAADAPESWRLRRPARPEDVVGPAAAALMRACLPARGAEPGAG
jgi:hypothetical protein